MKKVLVLGLMISLFTFENRSDVKIAHAGIISGGGTANNNKSITLASNPLGNQLGTYSNSCEKIIFINEVSQMPANTSIIRNYDLNWSSYIDSNGNEKTSDDILSSGIAQILISNGSSDTTHIAYILGKADVIYANPTSTEMFNSISALKELDLTKLDTSKVESANKFIYQCTSLEKIDLSNCDLSNVKNGLDEFFVGNDNLKVIKCPKALPSDSSLAINLPPQFVECYGITSLDSSNLSQYPVLNIPAENFVKSWKELRKAGDNGICAALTKETEGNTKLTQLLAEYDAFDNESKTYINKAIDKEDVTVGESITYVKNVLSGKQPTSGNYNGVKDDTGSYMTMSITEESPYLVAVISLIGILSVIGYYFYNKKKQAM